MKTEKNKRPKYKRWTEAELFASAKGLEYGTKEYEEYIASYNDALSKNQKGNGVGN